ncbi:MAG: hypothetical protein M3Q48_09050 [Actinomycetota bacterium]|jgi:hypothetical protein|nr:hypothetical protein [Actinomycetota bacterium]
MISEGTPVRLVCDVDGYELDRVPAGTYGVIVESYDVPVEGYAVDVALRDPVTGERVYDNVMLRPEQFRSLSHYCSVEIDTDLDAPGLVGLIADALHASAPGRTVRTNAAVVQLAGPWPRDPDYEATTGSRSFRWEAEVEGRSDATLDDVVSVVSGVLQALWCRGIPAVARSDYADRLPDSGGYERWKKLRPGERGVT